MSSATKRTKLSKFDEASKLVQTRITAFAKVRLEQAAQRAFVTEAQYVRLLIYKDLGVTDQHVLTPHPEPKE